MLHRKILIIEEEPFNDPLLLSDEPIEIDWDYVQQSLAAAEKQVEQIKLQMNLLQIKELASDLQPTKKESLKNGSL